MTDTRPNEGVVLLATKNQGKVRELRALLAGSGIEVIDLTGYPGLELPETGETFAENAAMKALKAARETGYWCLADDSGLEVEALGGMPGVRSARFSGEGATDQSNNDLLLERLRDVPPQQRGARFVSVVALASPDGVLITREGTAFGVIAQAPKGEGGFGYDPLFFVPDYGATYAELSQEQKNQISHRAKAFQAIKPEVIARLGVRQ